MADRVTEIRDALDYMSWIADVASDWPSIEENVGVLAEAARAYAGLLESGRALGWCEEHNAEQPTTGGSLG